MASLPVPGFEAILTGQIGIILSRLALVSLGSGYFALFVYFAYQSSRENQPMAARRAMLWALAVAVPHFILLLMPAGLMTGGAIGLGTFPLLGLLAYKLMPWPRPNMALAEPVARHDERDLVFVRAMLKQGTSQFEEYYQRRPELLEKDNNFRAKPGLMHLKSRFYHPYLFAAARGTFETIYFGLYYYADHHRFDRGVRPDPAAMSRFVKEWTKQLGAHAVGITAIKPEHTYTHHGYGDQYGQPVVEKDRYAIAFIVPMDFENIRTAPRPSAWLEVGRGYLYGATIGAALAGAIRQLGYYAHAQMLDHHDLIAPLVARDAGLGEIGRMSILMTPDLGPCVRIGHVTTDLPLVPDVREPDFGMLDVCLHCTKCADACPANAIPFGAPGDADGVLRWSIDHEACFGYWRKTGVPCGRCMAVCPFSLPDTPVHRVLKKTARHGGVWRYISLKLHDHFYGAKPRPLQMPDWVNVPEATEEIPGPDPDFTLPQIRVPGPAGETREVELPK